jgi:subtilase family serine protease
MRIGLTLGFLVVVGLSGRMGARQAPEQPRPARPDFDIRSGASPARASARALAELDAARARPSGPRRNSRLHPHTGGIRILDAPGWSVVPGASPAALRSLLQNATERLGLDEPDLAELSVARDYVSRSTGLRHVTFTQTIDGLPVFGGAITMHVGADGTVVRVTSGAARGAGRRGEPALDAESAATAAAADVSPDTPFVAARVGGAGPAGARFARGRFRRDVAASLEWFAMDGSARLAWHVEIEPEGAPQFYDLLVDAQSGQLLLRRNRVLDADGTGRVIQSDATQAADPRQPDQMPTGPAACPPTANHQLRDLTAPFRDAPSVLFNAGRLSGNNVHVYRGTEGIEGALGTFDGSRWTFDHPFNTAASAETALFFALNFAHDFFYDLGFDEAAGNFQVDNFGRGGAGGDPITGLARAPGRNNATYMHALEGSSPAISMFLFDGLGCWSEDVDGDGSLDIDGDYDTDVVLHEFHHGVSMRLNTTFTGNEAGAIGEGGSDYFAYTINGDTTLAEYSRPGGLRGINGKTYADWTCLLFIFCEVHDNGEIWANALWDVRERFRSDLVRGSEAAAINEANQLYIDGLKLSPPAPTMLDMRDSMLLADSVRNPGSPRSQNFCALWESFAGRGMGLEATDTADNGLNQVGADFSVPDGCVAPPAPLTVTVAATVNTATESGPSNGAFTVTRNQATGAALIVNLGAGGTANPGVDYVSLPPTATIPAGEVSVVVPLVPIDDTVVEGNETVVLGISAGAGYVAGAPATATVTIISDDVAPDLTVPALSVPVVAGAGVTISIDDTTRNQGPVTAGASTTAFYLSANTLFDPSDPLIGSRDVPELASGASHAATTPVTLPPSIGPGTYRIFAKADGPGVISESSEINNTRTDTIRIGPDLEVATLSAPASVGAGVAFNVTDTTANEGGGDSAASVTRFYLSAGFGLDATDLPLQSHTVDALAPGASQTVVTVVTIPAGTLGGLYYLYAVADADNVVAESTETNNTRYRSIRIGADLRVTDIDAPTRAAVGSTISVTDTTSNVGLSGAGSSRTAFYLSANILLDAGDFVLNVSRAVGPLEAGASSAGPTPITLPPAATAGTWYLLANADDLDEVGESLETNNVKSFQLSLGPDLSVSAATAPKTVTAGATISVSNTVLNSGLDTSGLSTTLFYLSVNSLLDASDTLLDAQRAVPGLGPNVTSSGSTPVPIPTGLSGRYYLIVVADGNHAVVESKETNNTRVLSVTINP